MAKKQQKISNGVKIIKSILISLLLVPFLVFAQAGLPAEGSPKAGLTPESPFYFIDKLGEALREFFTFNPEGKAHLQITFAAERVAEIKVILETKGVEAKGLEIAQARLQEHLGDAAEIVVKQKGKGKDISRLAKELDDELETQKSALADSFKAEKRTLEAKEDELKAQLKAAHRAGDTAKAEAIAQELGQVKAQLELLELKEEDIEDELEAEEEKLEEEMEAQHKAEKAIREAEEEKQEIIDEAAEEGVELPANAFTEFDSLLTQAKSALATGNFIEAKNLAKRAEKSLDQIEKTIEELEKKQEKREEEAEEATKEAEEEKQEDNNASDAMPRPTTGNSITIKDCKANPPILQVSKGAEVTVINADDEKHTLLFYDFTTGSQDDLELPAKGLVKTIKLSTPANSTNNFSCDQKTLPYGGAVYVMP